MERFDFEKYSLRVTERGFSLHDKETGAVIIDASNLKMRWAIELIFRPIERDYYIESDSIKDYFHVGITDKRD